ncbi:hypothetical protein [Vibrio cholerae]|uniref:hypothetical protein n=1 Tax=Vibrio cholerae TaxID=666 RepID=UPI000510DF9C|nr:hypothetical protein [Vibrio cholerae]EJK2105645.1 hypothetical protein [Vibrio cholerae]EKF9238136.1 hypothetical protein [Vibrio cholerae]EKF9739660.1 hypothetical protein [Vibrio cholerae]ELJ8530082.1 hypothetical protein [Vibrio cholerae]ELJ8571512.1 hypothetical protein [Vibrio cholerae]
MNKNNTLIIDFSGFESASLFTGRKNGNRAREHFHVKDADYFVFKANKDQLVTSSYFLGLVGKELMNLLSKVKDTNDLLTKVDMSGLNPDSQEECTRAIRRGLSSFEV